MKKRAQLRRLASFTAIAGLALGLVFAASIHPANVHAQVANAQCTVEVDKQTTTGTSGTLTFPDQCGTQNNTFEMVVNGSPTGVSVTINGLMPGGTVQQLLTSTSTVNVPLTVTGGPFASFQIVYTLTGGTSPSLTFNRRGTPLAHSLGGYSGVPNAVTVSGNAHIYRGDSMCAALAAATAGEVSGVLWATGYQGTQGCPSADLANMINPNFYGIIHLGCPLKWILPLVSQGAQSGVQPRIGVIPMFMGQRMDGCGTAGVASASQTLIIACAAAGSGPNCATPQTHEFPISSATIAYSNSRTYLRLASTGMDLVGREPVRVQNYNNTSGFSFPATICQNTQVVNGRLDPGCPNNPSATEVDIPVNSGIVTASVSAAGTGYSGTITVTFSGGSCLYEPTASATQSGGLINTVTILNRGRGCQTAPSGTVAGSGGGSGGTISTTVMAGCASTCGTLHAELPLFDMDNLGTNQMSGVLSGLIISCAGLPDCVPIRCLACQEQSQFKDLLMTSIQERCIDLHTFINQNGTHLEGDRCIIGSNPNSDVGTEAMYIGDTGPHGVVDWTGDFTSEPNPSQDCIRIDADSSFLYFTGGHCENTLYGILAGSGNATRGFRVDTWAGAPQGISLTAGMYQDENQSAVKIRSEYFTNGSPVSTVITSDYALVNILRNQASGAAFTVSDDNPLGPASAGYQITDLITGMYVVDQAGNGCETVLSTSQQGTWTTCAPWQIAMSVPAKTTIAGLASYCPTSGANVGGHAVASNCNAACSAGGTCTAGGSNVCEMYCTGAGTWLETGR